MIVLVVSALLSLVLLWLTLRLLAWAVVTIAHKYLHVHISIGSVGFFTFGHIQLALKNGMKVEIEKLWFSSSALNAEIKKPVAICLADVRVQVDVGKLHSRDVVPPNRADSESDNQPINNNQLLTHLGRLQGIGAIIDNVHVILLGGPGPECMTHITVQEIYAEGAVQHTSIEANLKVTALTTKILRRALQDDGSDSCLAEVSFSHQMSLLIDASDKSIEILSAVLKKPYVHIMHGLINQLLSSKTTQATTRKKTNSPSLLALIPKKVAIQLDESEFVISRETAQRQMSLAVKQIGVESQFVVKEDTIGNAQLKLVIKDVSTGTSQVHLASVSHCDIDAQLDENTLAILSTVKNGFLGYHHEEMQYWLALLPKDKVKDGTSTTDQISSKDDATSERSPVQSAFLGQRSLTVSSDIEHCCVAVATATCSGLKAGLRYAKVSFTINPATQGDGPGLINYDGRCEAEAMELYCKIIEGGPPVADLTSKHHHWNTIVYLGMFMLKGLKLAQELNIDAMLDSIQLEWSTYLASVVTQLITTIGKILPQTVTSKDQSQQHSGSAASKFTSLIKRAVVNLQLSNINIFCQNDMKVGLMLRYDSITCQQRAQEVSISCIGAKLVYFTVAGKSHLIVRSHELHSYVGHMKKLEASIIYSEKTFSIRLGEELYMMYTMGLHLCVYHAVQELTELQSKLPTRSSHLAGDKAGGKKSSSKISGNILIRANTMVALQLSGKHKVGFSSPEVEVELKNGQTAVSVPQLSIAFDQHDIISFQGIQVCSMHHSDHLRYERESYGSLKLPTNRAWSVAFDQITLTFPHEYNFAACFEQIINLNKWRKLVHKIKKKPFTIESPLPPDFVLKAKSVVIQLNDDPFEVKLGDNYQLLADESMENEKRMAAMEKKIQELRKKFTLLPANKVDELYTSLKRKGAEVYIQRSRQLYAASPMRTKLFTWSMDNVEITALADLSFHGKANCVKHMKDIDKDSPYPEEGLEYTSMFCRMVNASASSWTWTLRDHPQELLNIKDLQVWGRFIGAEEVAISRARRSAVVDVGAPWGSFTVERSMPPIKFYHDFSCEVQKFTMAYGACQEPAFAQFNACLNQINRPSVDPSPPLPFWDKMRLLLHGRLTMSVQKMRWLNHASFDPFNKTELMDWTWSDLILDWTNAKWVLRGDLDIYARTASKYDDCKLLHLPNLRFCIRLEWLCLGDPNDHHSVQPCAPDKVPEYSLTEHDSYRGFRSKNLNMQLSFETKPIHNTDEFMGDSPSCVFYASTLRWMDKIKVCMTHVARPIRRGKYFNVTTQRKPQLSRHLKNVQLSTDFHQFQVCYWVSFAKQHGIEMRGNSFRMSIIPHLQLASIEDGLIHRRKANWSICHFECELNSATIWLCSSTADGEEEVYMRGPVNKNYFLSVEKVTYHRNEPVSVEDSAPPLLQPQEDMPLHKVQIYDLKGAWSQHSRNVAFTLHDGFARAQTLRRNLRADALKGFKVDSSQTPIKSRSTSINSPPASGAQPSPSPLSKLQSGPGYTMLQKLVSEADSRFVAVHEEVSGGSVQVEQLQGIASCTAEDVVQRNWHIELYNSQVLLKGCETQGYVIVSAAKASILSCEHQPVWKDRQLKGKTTWVGSVECMQYYATVDPGDESFDDIPWLAKENIEMHEDSSTMSEMAGSGHCVGGVVSDSGAGQDYGTTVQLQRIISRCKCQFFYASYGEVDPDMFPEVPPPPAVEDHHDMMKREEGVDAFTLLHHDLNICTNSLQYAMILDIVNNLLLHVEPKKKEVNEKLQNMRFKLQLCSVEDQKTPILLRQNNLRQMLATIRRSERELHMIHKALDDAPQNQQLLDQSLEIEQRLYEMKQQLSTASQELTIMISCFKEGQLQIQAKHKTTKAQQGSLLRRNEVCFKHAEWRMTEADGQIGIADLVLRNFLYCKLNSDDDSGAHQLELGYVKVTNLLPNSLYRDVLLTQDPGKSHSDHQMALRILCKFKAPVGGIAIREHFEVNVTPLTIALTYRFYKSVMNFFFPGKNIDAEDEKDEPDSDTASIASAPAAPSAPPRSSRRKPNIRMKVLQHTDEDDIDIMKERAAMNNVFVFVKIPEVPMKVSYKGGKDKNIEDVHEVSLLLPTLEYHNQTWTWLDFLLAIKKDTKKVLIAQAIKQKLHMKSRQSEEALRAELNVEEDKAKMLLGAKLLGGAGSSDKPSSKKSLFGKSSKS